MPDTQELARHVKPYVHESLRSKALHFSIAEVQSCMRLEDPHALALEYTRTMMGFLLFQPAPRDIAMIGLGGGSLAKFCHRYLPAARIEVAEINPHVIALRDEFHVPADDDRFRVVKGDGALFVRQRPSRCDVLLVDGFDSNGQPARLSAQRFYDDCHDMLQPDGVLVVNLHSGHPRFDIFTDRIRRSFDDAVLIVDGADLCNSIVFAFKGPALAAARHTPPRAPATLDASAARQLQSSFALITRALKQPAP